MTTHEYWKESDSMSLSQFAEYYKDGGYPQAFIVEEISGRREHELQEGQIVIACHERKVRVLQAMVLLKDGGKLPVTIPINLAVQFALLPADNSESFWGCPKLSVKDIVHPKDGVVPKAVQVMEACTNSKKQQVPAKEVLYNVSSFKKLGKRGFTGTSAIGVRHTFHEGNSTAQFSSRLGDNKVYPVKFFDHITFPQKARVYLKEGEECQVEGLEHLCNVEFTGRHEQHFLAIKTNVDDPESHECQSVPFNLDILVSAVTLKGYPLDKLTMKDRKMIKHLSSGNIVQPTGNLYVTQPIDPTIRDEPDPVPLCQPTPSDSRRQSQISIGRSQSSFSVGMEITYYNWPPEDTEEVSSPQSRRGSKLGVMLYPPGCAHSEHRLSTLVESPDYSYVEINFPPQDQWQSPPTPPPQHAKPKHTQRMSLPPQPPPVLPRPHRPDLDGCDEETSTYEEMTVQDQPLQQVPVRLGWAPPQPHTPKPPSTAAAVSVLHEHSPKPCPKGVPSTAIPLIPLAPPPTKHASKKPLNLASCPKEMELRQHVVGKLGKDWRKVCANLGLQPYELKQADTAHSKLEDKAMEALKMWLNGKAEQKESHTWKTVVKAFRSAGKHELASDLQKCIRNGMLPSLQPSGK